MALIHYHGQTDVGRRRPTNEDAILVSESALVVCDGLGGHAAGEVAAALAVETIAAVIGRPPAGEKPGSDADRLRTAIRLANRAILDRARSDPACAGMGTTVAVAILPPDSTMMTYAHVGDSRIYLIRGGAAPVIRPLTRDDSWSDAGSAYQHLLTKALGLTRDVEPALGQKPLDAGDTVLLCSDGLTTMVSDPRILELMTAHGDALPAACQALVDAANAAGGRDNISVILARRGE